MARFGIGTAAAALAALLAAGTARATASLPDGPSPVVDGAGLLSTSLESRLAGRLQRLEATTGQRLMVVTVGGLDGRPLEDVIDRLARHWGLADPDAPPSVLLFAAWRERELWLGRTAGAVHLPADQAQAVLDEVIVPAFHAGAFDRGVEDGIAALAALLETDTPGVRPAATAIPAARAGERGGLAIAGALLWAAAAGALALRQRRLAGGAHPGPGAHPVHG